MIIIGYQGVGKSTIGSREKDFIDLESSSFFVDGKRQDNWYIIYCEIAKKLSDDKKYVFVSSHKEVREYLKNNYPDDTIALCPDSNTEMRDIWIKRLEDRYNYTNLEKDFKALKNAQLNYLDNTKDIIDSGFNTIIITEAECKSESIIAKIKMLEKDIEYLARTYDNNGIRVIIMKR